MNPRISIVVPTFDRLPLLKLAVESVLAQTRDDWQLVVVDDGSRDGTAAYLAGLSDQRIEVVIVDHCANPARLRNIGIARAAADWVAFLDSDDLWAPHKLATQVGALAEHPECRWSYTGALLIDEAGTELPLENYDPWTPRSGYILLDLLTHAASIPCPSVLVQRDLVRAVGGFDESLVFSEDYDLWLRLAVVSPVWALSEPLCKIRLHPTNNTRGKVDVDRSFIQVYEKVLRGHASNRLVRKICDRQRAYYWLHIGRHLWRRGERTEGLIATVRALRYQPAHPDWWTAVAKKLLPAWLTRG